MTEIFSFSHVCAAFQAPASVNVLGESGDDIAEFGETRATPSKTVDLVINGALVETKLFIYGKVRCTHFVTQPNACWNLDAYLFIMLKVSYRPSIMATFLLQYFIQTYRRC